MSRLPVDYLTDTSVEFVRGELVVDAPVEVRAAHGLAANVARELEGRTLRGVCQVAGLNRSTVQTLLAGRSFCDTVTLAKLEAAFGVVLWPGLT